MRDNAKNEETYKMNVLLTHSHLNNGAATGYIPPNAGDTEHSFCSSDNHLSEDGFCTQSRPKAFFWFFSPPPAKCRYDNVNVSTLITLIYKEKRKKECKKNSTLLANTQTTTRYQ